jgi:hypothetical protein
VGPAIECLSGETAIVSAEIQSRIEAMSAWLHSAEPAILMSCIQRRRGAQEVRGRPDRSLDVVLITLALPSPSACRSFRRGIEAQQSGRP